MRFFAMLAVLCLLFGCSRFPESTPAKNAQEAQKEEQYKKELDEVRKTIKGEVKELSRFEIRWTAQRPQRYCGNLSTVIDDRGNHTL